MSERVYSAVPLGWVHHADRHLAISRVHAHWAALNGSAASLLKACEGRGRTLDDLRAELAPQFGAVAPEDLAIWLDNLAEVGLLEAEHATPAPGASADYRVEHVYLELLARCNLRCVHCFMGGAPEREEELTPDQVFALLDQFADRGGQYVTLSGGEPLLYRRFDDVARHVADRGINGAVITNGVSLREDQLHLLDRLGFNIAISIDGITPSINEAIRGRGPAKPIESIDRTLAAVGADRFVLSYTPVKANLADMPRLFDFIESRGIRRLNLSIYEAVGRAADHADMLSLDADDRLRLIRMVYDKAIDWIGKVEIDFNDTRNVLSQFSAGRAGPDVHPLWRGVRVTSSGDVFPSSFGAVERFRLGNVNDDSFAQLLESDVLAKLYANLVDRDAKIPKCRDCVWRQICRGGSVASAFCTYGEMHAPDAYCEAYLDVFPKVALALADLAGAPS